MAVTDIYHVAGSMEGRSAVNFLGGNTDDYIQVDAAGAALTSNAAKVGTWTAWVMPQDITATTTIIGAGDGSAVEFIDFGIEVGLLTARCTVSGTVQWVTQADQIDFKAHRWYHIAMVKDTSEDGPKLYVNGVVVAATNDTTTDLPAFFDQTTNIDDMRIGAASKAGDGSVTNEFGGAISDVKLWNIGLTAAEIASEFRNVPVQAANLQNHWTFDDDLLDDGLGNDAGTNTGSGSLLVSGWCEFASRLAYTTGSPVVADTVKFAINSLTNTGHAVVIQAA